MIQFQEKGRTDELQNGKADRRTEQLPLGVQQQ